jgi:arsenate reductase (thioredoxin)
MPPVHKLRVLFVCLGNACRSPMAESIARHIASDIIEPSSAGIHPLGRIAEATEKVLRANGYPSVGLTSKPLKRITVDQADLVINMSGKPVDNLFAAGRPVKDPLIAKKVENWKVEDPYGEDPATYQRILEELESRVLMLAARLRSGERAAHS